MSPITIYHRNTIYSAYKICRSGQIWSKDGYQQANFHEEKFGGGSICGSEITLIFEWSGQQAPSPEKWPAEPNVLYRAPWGGDESKLWSLVLFSGTTDDLRLVGFCHVTINSDDAGFEHKHDILSEIAKLVVGCPTIVVPEAAKRSLVPPPELPKPGLWQRLIRSLSNMSFRRTCAKSRAVR